MEEDFTKYVSNLKIPNEKIFDIFENHFLQNSQIRILESTFNNDFKRKKYKLATEDGVYTLYLRMKNVTYGGWDDKPWIRRIQIEGKYLIDLPEITNNSLFLLGGLVYYKEEPLFVFWNPRRYTTIKTIGSCYVNVSSIKSAYDEKYYYSIDSGKEVYLSDKENITTVIKDFLKNNYVEQLNW